MSICLPSIELLPRFYLGGQKEHLLPQVCSRAAGKVSGGDLWLKAITVFERTNEYLVRLAQSVALDKKSLLHRKVERNVPASVICSATKVGDIRPIPPNKAVEMRSTVSMRSELR